MTTITVPRHSEIAMPLPDPSDIHCRPSGIDWLLQLDRLYMWTDIDGMAALQAILTRALCDAGEAERCLTPEDVMRGAA